MNDLQRVAEFTRQQSREKELELTTSLVKATEQLRAFPYSGSVYRASAADPESRSLLVGKMHRLVYKVDEADEVTILQVLDMRSDNK